MSEAAILLPCPHCGEAEHLYPSYRNMGAGAPYAIDCLGCGADYVPRDGMDVIAMWNRRPALLTELASALDELVDALTAGYMPQKDGSMLREARALIAKAGGQK